jgi:hypothetical protein
VAQRMFGNRWGGTGKPTAWNEHPTSIVAGKLLDSAVSTQSPTTPHPPQNTISKVSIPYPKHNQRKNRLRLPNETNPRKTMTESSAVDIPSLPTPTSTTTTTPPEIRATRPVVVTDPAAQKDDGTKKNKNKKPHPMNVESSPVASSSPTTQSHGKKKRPHRIPGKKSKLNWRRVIKMLTKVLRFCRMTGCGR